jgi:hypothetical protein
MKKIFDYHKIAKEMQVPHNVLKAIEHEVREEFHGDQMMYELHVLRALKSKYWQKRLSAAA